MDSTEYPMVPPQDPGSMKVISKNRTKYDIENHLWFFMPLDEERAYYNEVLERVIKNPRYYLDNLDDLSVFRVSFIHYYKEK